MPQGAEPEELQRYFEEEDSERHLDIKRRKARRFAVDRAMPARRGTAGIAALFRGWHDEDSVRDAVKLRAGGYSSFVSRKSFNKSMSDAFASSAPASTGCPAAATLPDIGTPIYPSSHR